MSGTLRKSVYRPYTANRAGLVTTFVGLKFFLRIGSFGSSLGPSLLICGITKTGSPLSQIFKSMSSCSP